MQCNHLNITWLTFLLITVFTNCQRPNQSAKKTTVRVRLDAAPERVDPILASTLTSQQISSLLFLPLLDFDPETLELVPVLAIELPQINIIEAGPWRGGVAYTFEIRPQAQWDDGRPMTAKDYIFTIKTILHPGINAAPYRAYLNFLKDIEVSPTNPRKFTIITDRPFLQAPAALGNLGLYPQKIYDPDDVMGKYSIKQLKNTALADSIFRIDEKMRSFADDFNQKDRTTIIGGGGYQMEGWQSDQQIILTKKKNWWGNKLPELASRSVPEKIVFSVIPDINSAISLLQADKLDILTGIPPAKFEQLKLALPQYDFYTPQKLSYHYLAINGNRSYLDDTLTRRALAHLVDVPLAIKTLWNGKAQRLTGPIHPAKSYYQHDLPPIDFDLVRARELFVMAGWKDYDEDGILDKIIDGKKQSLILTYRYKSQNQIAEQLGLLFQKAARKVGVNIIVEGQELKTLLTGYRQRNYDLLYLSWTRPPGPDDLRQTWHSTSRVAGGSNRTGFGTPESDHLIDNIRQTNNLEDRKELYLRIQEIIYQQQPYIFLYTPLECLVVHQSLSVKPSVRYPGYYFFVPNK